MTESSEALNSYERSSLDLLLAKSYRESSVISFLVVGGCMGKLHLTVEDSHTSAENGAVFCWVHVGRNSDNCFCSQSHILSVSLPRRLAD